MQEEILKRGMFAKPMSKETRNSGIMAGFEDMEDENFEEPVAPEEEMSPMARTPQNPEILMNNLRGDIRSVDARVQELAQMVGEEAAMETPPEVLAMLQMQLAQPAPAAAPQGGIGALPQAAGMMPPGMPPQGAGPQAPVGAPPFPQGASAPQQFSHGGAVAPATHDGMPPLHAQVGAFVTPMTRAAQFLGDKAALYGSEANALLGRMFMNPSMTQPFLENVRGPGGRFTAEQINRGGNLLYPTFTEGIATGAQKLAQEYPRVAQALAPIGAAATATFGPLLGEPASKLSPEDQARYDRQQEALREIDAMPSDRQKAAAEAALAEEQKKTQAAAAKDDLGAFIAERTAAKDKERAATGETPTTPAATTGTDKTTVTPIVQPAKELSRVERIRAERDELTPLYKELLGDSAEDMRANAMLMLADAGFKYAALSPKRGQSAASVFAEAVSGLPRGFAALAAQARDRDIKLNTAALQQAVSNVQEQDKYAQQLKLEMLKGDYRVLAKQAEQGGATLEDGGAGLVIGKTKGGGYVGTSIDPKNPTVQSAINSRWTLRDTDNPFVENRGQAPTTVETDKAERVKLTSTLRSLDNSLATLDNLKGTYTSAYGPGAWFYDKVNNLLVPVSPKAPIMDVSDAATRISTGMNTILKNIASANDGGRVAVQEQEWARDTAKGISDPTKFFADKELAAQQFNSMEAMLRNSRQQVLTQLGYEGNDYVMRTPSTGTQNDPFVVPTDPEQQKRMFTFLGSTIGRIQDPRATVYLKLPNNTIQAFNPTQLQGLIK